MWLLASLPGYVGWRLIPALAAGPAGESLGFAALLAACAVIPLAVNTRSMVNRRAADRLAWVGLYLMGFLSTLFVATVLRDLFLLTAHAFADAHIVAAWVRPSARWALGLTAASTVIGLGMARWPRLVHIDVPVEGLPPALAGFSIAQISDLHVGPTIKRGFVERIVRRVNALQADVIAITGDLVDGSVADLSHHTAALASLSARHGVFFVTGNHEYYSGERAWTAELRRLGLTVLKNQHVVLVHDGAPLLLAGVTDYSAHHFDPAQRSDPAAALRMASPGKSAAGSAGSIPATAATATPTAATMPKILLAHQPGSAQAAATAGFDVQLSGHTHGGQFFPWNLLVGFFQPFTRGMNRLGKLRIYVSRGTGYWGPPNRFGVPSEITRLRLVAAPLRPGV